MTEKQTVNLNMNRLLAETEGTMESFIEGCLLADDDLTECFRVEVDVEWSVPLAVFKLKARVIPDRSFQGDVEIGMTVNRDYEVRDAYNYDEKFYMDVKSAFDKSGLKTKIADKLRKIAKDNHDVIRDWLRQGLRKIEDEL